MFTNSRNAKIQKLTADLSDATKELNSIVLERDRLALEILSNPQWVSYYMSMKLDHLGFCNYRLERAKNHVELLVFLLESALKA